MAEIIEIKPTPSINRAIAMLAVPVFNQNKEKVLDHIVKRMTAGKPAYGADARLRWQQGAP